jgi:hypothetical protein
VLLHRLPYSFHQPTIKINMTTLLRILSVVFTFALSACGTTTTMHDNYAKSQMDPGRRPGAARSIDDRLVGSWQGQRNQDGKCSFRAWTMIRTADGRFQASIFGDAEKSDLFGQQEGQWEARGGMMAMFVDGVPLPEIYTYTFIDENSVKLTNTQRDSSGDCMADYEFTDHRVSK